MTFYLNMLITVRNKNGDYQFYARLFFFSYNHLKLTLGVLLTGSTVAMVTYFVGKLIITCLSTIRHFFDTIIVVLADKEW